MSFVKSENTCFGIFDDLKGFVVLQTSAVTNTITIDAVNADEIGPNASGAWFAWITPVFILAVERESVMWGPEHRPSDHRALMSEICYSHKLFRLLGQWDVQELYGRV